MKKLLEELLKECEVEIIKNKIIDDSDGVERFVDEFIFDYMEDHDMDVDLNFDKTIEKATELLNEKYNKISYIDEFGNYTGYYTKKTFKNMHEIKSFFRID